MRPKLFPAALLLALCSAGSAGAAVLYSDPMSVGGATAVVACSAVNVYGKNLDVLVELVDPTGAVLAFGSSMLTAKGGIGSVGYGVAGDYSCRVTFSGSAKRVRASISGKDAGGGTLASSPAR